MHTRVACPYCGEQNSIFVDPSAGRHQRYVEDCQVCCQPWEVTIDADDEGELVVDVRRTDD